MAKSIFKEISVMLLFCIAMLLILGIIFYSYIPSNKLVPNRVTAYSTPENVKGEIDESITDYTGEKVYEITDSDLSLYKQKQSYNPGKADPFAAYSQQTDANGDNNDTNSVPSNTNSTTNNPDATDNFYEQQGTNKGTK